MADAATGFCLAAMLRCRGIWLRQMAPSPVAPNAILQSVAGVTPTLGGNTSKRREGRADGGPLRQRFPWRFPHASWLGPSPLANHLMSKVKQSSLSVRPEHRLHCV